MFKQVVNIVTAAINSVDCLSVPLSSWYKHILDFLTPKKLLGLPSQGIRSGRAMLFAFGIWRFDAFFFSQTLKGSPLGRRGRRGKDIIKLDFNCIGWKCTNWFHPGEVGYKSNNVSQLVTRIAAEDCNSKRQ